MGVVCFIFLLGSLRTNLCFVGIFATLVTAFGLLTRAYWLLAEDYQGNAARATDIIVVSSKVSISAWFFSPVIKMDANGMADRLAGLSSLLHACLAGTSSLPSSWTLWTSHCRCPLETCPGFSSPRHKQPQSKVPQRSDAVLMTGRMSLLDHVFENCQARLETSPIDPYLGNASQTFSVI